MPPKVHALPADELAILAGVSETTWKAHRKEGAPFPRSEKDIRQWLVRYHAWRKANGKVQSGDHVDSEITSIKREHERLKVMLTRIELRERLGLLVERKEVVAAHTRAALTVRQRLNAMVKKLAMRIGPMVGKDGESIVEEQLQAEVDSICEAFSLASATNEDDRDRAGSGGSRELETAGEADGEPMG